MTQLRFVKTPEQLIEAAENNLEFFSESSSNNPLLIEVNKKIEKLNNDKFILETKLKHIKSFLKQKLDENGNQ